MFGVGSRALSTGKGLEFIAALVCEFDGNPLSFGEIQCLPKLEQTFVFPFAIQQDPTDLSEFLSVRLRL